MENVITDSLKIDEILDRGTIVNILPTKEEFKNKLLGGQKLRLYIGFDATSPVLHLSHAKNFMLMEKFRKLGHEVIILFGDFTARIGDPSDVTSARKQMTKEEVDENVTKWKELVKPLMNFDDPENPPIIKYNSEWLAGLNFEQIADLASNFTVQQMIERDMFQKRLKDDKPIYLHEFLYPLMQGYDSVEMDVDAEVCGTDQIFNALAGRTLLKKLKNKDKFVIAVTLMEDPKTGEMMSKSRGVGVFLGTTPEDMYGQVMAQNDEMIEPLFINNTDLPLDEIKNIMDSGNPRDAKMKLALEITRIFHGEEKAKAAEDHFVKVIQQKQTPEFMEEINIGRNNINIVDLVFESEMAPSKSEARRLVEQKAVEVNDKIIDDPATLIDLPEEGAIVKVGKRTWAKILP